MTPATAEAIRKLEAAGNHALAERMRQMSEREDKRDADRRREHHHKQLALPPAEREFADPIVYEQKGKP